MLLQFPRTELKLQAVLGPQGREILFCVYMVWAVKKQVFQAEGLRQPDTEARRGLIHIWCGGH